MRHTEFLSLALLIPAACSAQIIGNSVAFNGPIGMRQQTNSPVSFVMEHKTIQTLNDGTHITTIVLEHFYRDSLGRTRMESENLTFAGRPHSSISHMVNVTDPVEGVRLSWITGEGTPNWPQTYNRMTVTAPQPVVNSQMQTPPPSVPVLQRAPVPRTQRPMPKTTHEDLGATTVQGETCQASRNTTVIPVDFFGNDRPFTQVVETCLSRDLGRSILDRSDDPRTGVRTSMLQSISHSEPDPALFLPPPGYTEQVQNNRP